MSKKRQIDVENTTAARVAAEINRLLEDAGMTLGYGKMRLWEEWLTYTRVVLEVTLRPFRDGTPMTDAPVREEEERLRDAFSAHGRADYLIERFQEAAVLWYTYSSTHVEDVLGLTYMVHMYPSQGAGQFFTPWEVCVFMAQLTIPNGAREVFERIKTAVGKLREADPLAGMYAETIILTAAGLIQEENPSQSIEPLLINLLPLIQPYYEPISIDDPCCGSGGMLLAASLQFPAFANRMGLVQYFGQDIDLTCANMANLNMMAYGLNGWGAAAVYYDLLEAGMPVPALARDPEEEETAELETAGAPAVVESREHSGLLTLAEPPSPIDSGTPDSTPATNLPAAPFVLRPARSNRKPKAHEDQMVFGFLEEADVA